MKQTLDGQLASADGLGLLDFTRAPGGRAGSKAAEGRRFLDALRRCCQVRAGQEGGACYPQSAASL